uniref:Uncharacterized protein n=1 Tax=uncultured bacterium BLR12 TaxID=506514 RepID=C0INE7_9BACT|nr:hypothetical protein AKSOIL_0218 [uncultured bacterium BLR12]
MNNVQKYCIYLLLIFTFSLRFVVPVFAGFYYSYIDQQEEKSTQEKGDQKLAFYEVEVTDIVSIWHGVPSWRNRPPALLGVPDVFLPVQYFAIPTPPPWYQHN